jgi:hypothetical protein
MNLSSQTSRDGAHDPPKKIATAVTRTVMAIKY